MKMVQLPIRLAIIAFAIHVTPTSSYALKLRGPAPAPAPAGAPAESPAPAPAPIRPGVVVQVTASREQLHKDFSGVKSIHYVPLMDEMLGKTFVVKELKYGGVGIPSPNGSQDETWYFPAASLTPWLDTPAAKEVPVPSKAFKAVGLPTRTRLDIGPPGRHDAPWEYTIKGRNLMDPIAPPQNLRVDLEKTSQPLPPWRKVKQVVSVECMELMHKDPTHICKPDAYVDYNLVKPAPTTPKPISPAEAEELRRKIKHLKITVDRLTPPEALPKIQPPKMENPVKDSGEDMIKTLVRSNNYQSGEAGGEKMKVGAEHSEARLPTAGGEYKNNLKKANQTAM